MLQIIKKDGTDGYEKILSGLSLDGNENVRISEAVNGDKIDGYGIYELSPEKMIIYKICYGGDLMLADGILRSILFLAAMRGVERAEFMHESDCVAKKLGILKDGAVLEPISDIFGGCESCRKEN